MDKKVLQVEDLNLPADFKFVEGKYDDMVDVCGICSNCCYSDCTGGN